MPEADEILPLTDKKYITPVIGDKRGEFFMRFASSKTTCGFYGEKISQLEAFRRYGNLPHNNILANKLINHLGRNLLDLEKQKIEREKDDSRSPERKNEVEHYDQMERECNAFTISILAALTPLEQDRFNEGNPVEIGQVKDEIFRNVFKLYHDRFDYLQSKLQDEHLSEIKKNRYERLKNQLTKDFANLRNTLRQPNTRMQTIYRQVMENYRAEQQAISVYQHNADRLLDYANQSLTNSYQDASSSIEGHIFSSQRPTDQQLWMNQADKPTILDSRNYPSLRKKRDAIFTRCFIEKEKNAQRKSKEFTQDIITASKKAKEKTEGPLKRKRAGSAAEIGTNLSPTTPKAWNKLYAQYHTPEQENIYDEAEPLAPEQPVHVYEGHDILSAVGETCEQFGKYFEHEMAAKHPVMTSVFFTGASALFGAAGLAAHGVLGAEKAFSSMTHFISSMTGKQVSASQVNNALASINDAWLKVTYSKNAPHSLIMSGFVLPKVTFLAADMILNKPGNKDLVAHISKKIEAQHLEHIEDAEQRAAIAKKIAASVLILGASTAMGVGVFVAAKSHIAIGHAIGGILEPEINISPQTLTSLAHTAPTASAELMQILSTALTLKSSTLFVGKLMLLKSCLSEEMAFQNDNQRHAFDLMVALKIKYDQGQLNKSILKDPNFKIYRTEFEKLIRNNPNLKEDFIHDFGAGFLKKCGITNVGEQKIQTQRWYQKVGTGLKTAFWDKSTKPIGQFLTGFIARPIVGIHQLFNRGKFPDWWKNDVGGLRTGLNNGTLAITKLISPGVAGHKTALIAIWGAAKRAAMATSDTLFGIAASVSYLLNRDVEGFPRRLVSLVGKLGLTTGNIISNTLLLTGEAIKWGFKIASVPFGLINGGISAALGKKFKNGFNNWWQAPDKVTQTIYDKGFKPVKNWIQNQNSKIDAEIYATPGNQYIQRARDNTTIGISRGFDWVKRKAGRAVYQLRNVFIRRHQEDLQAIHAHHKESTHGKENKNLSEQELLAQIARRNNAPLTSQNQRPHLPSVQSTTPEVAHRESPGYDNRDREEDHEHPEAQI